MKILILGGSRGLGLALKNQLQSRGHEVVAFSRSTERKMDFTDDSQWSLHIGALAKENPDQIIYCAGGGPHGNFSEKNFRDHLWALKLNFEFPAYLLHQILQRPGQWANLQQICFVGSSIAESLPDARASSYAAAKHALRGLIQSVQLEDHGALDIRLFSPGYMDTALLPRNAWPRQKAGLVKSPEEIAKALIEWAENPQYANKHQVFE